MKLLRWERLTTDETLARFKRTRLKGFGQPYVYEQATLSLVKAVETERVVPAQRYVLESDLQSVFALEKMFAVHGINIYALEGALMFWIERDGEEEGPIPLTPPIVEQSLEADGRKIWLINDGMHRVTAARQRNTPINIILAESVPQEYPYYALPLPNGWADVQELAELQDGFQKKAYRVPENYKALFRDFNEVFPGIQKQRKQSNPEYVRE